jgi:alkaline phosphatase
MMRRTFLITIGILSLYTVNAQYNYPAGSPGDSLCSYKNPAPYTVKDYSSHFKKAKPKNIILMIGDGMGLAQVFAGMTANGGKLYLNNFYVTGFVCTQSSDNYITDSGAGGSALANGHKSKNGHIGLDEQDKPAKSILEYAEDKGLATGLVATVNITHATPASFIAHGTNRSDYEFLAEDFLRTDIDVFIGGGYDYFANRRDSRDLTIQLKEKGYKVITDMSQITGVKSGKLAGLTAPKNPGRATERKDMLPLATENALRLLSENRKGFFVMIEGSQIDWGGHANNLQLIVEEMLDFDRSIGKALDFAAANGNTLIIVTADHETGGLAITGGDISNNSVKAAFCTKDHSGIMVPVFAYGPGAENFTGIMQNTDIFEKMYNLLIK